MNPQQQLPPDYLDQIAPQAAKRSFAMNRTGLFVFFGVIAIVIVIILAVIVSAVTNGRTEPWQRLTARLSATSEIAKSSEGKIKNSQLRSANSNLQISLTNTQRDLVAPLQTIGINIEKIPTNVTQTESSAAMIARLEDARLNAKYDSTYAREMSFQLSNVLTLLRQTYASSKNEMNKTFLMTTYDNLAPVQKTLSEFSASNE
jgi:predicted outer membrane protein